MKKRNIAIDLMRILGIILVISAHTNVNGFYFELREFDVCMLFVISGMSYQLTSGKNKLPYKDYVIQRFKRLILPIWEFLCVFFVFMYLLKGKQFSNIKIIKSFMLVAGGIQFVWVFREFFIASLMNPILEKYSNKNWIKTMIIVLITLVINDVLYQTFCLDVMGLKAKVFEYLITYNVSYVLLSFIGMVSIQLDQKKRWVIALCACMIYCMLGIHNGFLPLIQFKHPPLLYYISYGVMWTMVLYNLLENCSLKETTQRKVVWLSKNSMNVYVAHIVFVYVFGIENVYLALFVYLIGSTIAVYGFDALKRLKK